MGGLCVVIILLYIIPSFLFLCRRPRPRDYELECKRLASQLEETTEHPLQAIVSVSLYSQMCMWICIRTCIAL